VNSSGAKVQVTREVSNNNTKGISEENVTWQTADGSSGGSYASNHSGADHIYTFADASGNSTGQLTISSNGQVMPSADLTGAAVTTIEGSGFSLTADVQWM
jgi:hypothetical protein